MIYITDRLRNKIKENEKNLKLFAKALAESEEMRNKNKNSLFYFHYENSKVVLKQLYKINSYSEKDLKEMLQIYEK